jgi:hypothetical protein
LTAAPAFRTRYRLVQSRPAPRPRGGGQRTGHRCGPLAPGTSKLGPSELWASKLHSSGVGGRPSTPPHRISERHISGRGRRIGPSSPPAPTSLLPGSTTVPRASNVAPDLTRVAPDLTSVAPDSTSVPADHRSHRSHRPVGASAALRARVRTLSRGTGRHRRPTASRPLPVSARRAPGPGELSVPASTHPAWGRTALDRSRTGTFPTARNGSQPGRRRPSPSSGRTGAGRSAPQVSATSRPCSGTPYLSGISSTAAALAQAGRPRRPQRCRHLPGPRSDRPRWARAGEQPGLNGRTFSPLSCRSSDSPRTRGRRSRTPVATDPSGPPPAPPARRRRAPHRPIRRFLLTCSSRPARARSTGRGPSQRGPAPAGLMRRRRSQPRPSLVRASRVKLCRVATTAPGLTRRVHRLPPRLPAPSA